MAENQKTENLGLELYTPGVPIKTLQTGNNNLRKIDSLVVTKARFDPPASGQTKGPIEQAGGFEKYVDQRIAPIKTDINNLIVSGYIAATSKAYAWAYRKSGDGTLECWTSIAETLPFSSWSGAVSSSPAISLKEWPVGISFISSYPVVRHCEPQTATYQDNGTKGAYLTFYSGNAASAGAPGTFYLTQVDGVGLAGKSVTFAVDIHVIGKWR